MIKIKSSDIKEKGKIVGKVDLIKTEKSNKIHDEYIVYGELFEHPRLQAEKVFQSKLKAIWNFVKLKITLRSTYNV